MSAEHRSRRPRVVALIAPGDGPHLVAPGVVPAREWRRPARLGQRLDASLAGCLALLSDHPDRFESAAMAWHARWCSRIPEMTLAEAQSGLKALEALQGDDALDGALELRRLCVQHAMWDVAEVLRRWIARLPGRDGSGSGGGAARTRSSFGSSGEGNLRPR